MGNISYGGDFFPPAAPLSSGVSSMGYYFSASSAVSPLGNKLFCIYNNHSEPLFVATHDYCDDTSPITIRCASTDLVLYVVARYDAAFSVPNGSLFRGSRSTATEDSYSSEGNSALSGHRMLKLYSVHSWEVMAEALMVIASPMLPRMSRVRRRLSGNYVRQSPTLPADVSEVILCGSTVCPRVYYNDEQRIDFIDNDDLLLMTKITSRDIPTANPSGAGRMISHLAKVSPELPKVSDMHIFVSGAFDRWEADSLAVFSAAMMFAA